MNTNDISESLRSFISQYIRSVRELEVLLLLAEHDREWTTGEIAEKMYVDDTAAGRILDGLAESGLISKTGDEAPTYRYSASGHGHDAAVRELATTYRLMRPRIVDIIYGAPDDDLQSFSEAFRLRRGKE